MKILGLKIRGRAIWIAAAILGFLGHAGIRAQEVTSGLENSPSETGIIALQTLCDRTREQADVPGFWMAVGHPDGSTAVVASGLRKVNSSEPVTTDDLVHIGSCTKAFTVHLIARLVEQGILRWEQTIGETLTGERFEIHEDYQSATLEQLLQHRANVPANAKNWHAHFRVPLLERRTMLIRENLSEAPEAPTENGYRYSNLSYLVAAKFAEEATGQTWNSLMQTEIFEPLGLTSAGFGPPGDSGQVAQPWGHLPVKTEAKWLPMQRDNSEAFGPAGTIHLSISDWIGFARLYATPLPSPTDPPNENANLTAETMQRILRSASPNGYAMGWIVLHKNDQPFRMQHAGSNTMWFAIIEIDPQSGQIWIAVANGMNDQVEKAALKSLNEMRKIEW
ncbi:MAG: beta-lactamase family protein [Pirellulaceae bacterium]|nr:beta-lactamase family protein [Pirellulaceae bacterium]